MSELPRGWVTATLGELCPGRVEQREPGLSPTPYIDIGSIDRATKQIAPTQTVTAKDSPTRARQWVAKGDVLVSMTRPNLNAVALVPKGLDGAVASTGFDALRTEHVLPEWIFNRVRSHEFIADVCEGLQGVVYPAIRPSDVRRHRLPVPPLAEQKRIVEAIESHSTRIDVAGAMLERAQRNLKRYRASALKAAVEGRLVPTEAEVAREEGRDYEPATSLLESILAERRCRWQEAGGRGRYPEPIAPNTNALPGLPEGWCWVTGDQVSERITKGSSPKWQGFDYCDDGLPFVRSQNVRWGSLDLADLAHLPEAFNDKETRSVLRADDVLLNIVGASIGRAAVADARVAGGNTNQAVAIIRLVHRGLLPKLACLYLISPASQRSIDRAKVDVARANLSLADIANLAFPLPPAAEQKRIVFEVDQLISVGEVAGEVILSNQARLARLRQSILKWAFEGKLVDQVPNDEPASVLLERIKAVRAAAAPVAKPRAKNLRAKVTR